jgi:hypothetical protein
MVAIFVKEMREKDVILAGNAKVCVLWINAFILFLEMLLSMI